jgi:hypothetical protein
MKMGAKATQRAVYLLLFAKGYNTFKLLRYGHIKLQIYVNWKKYFIDIDIQGGEATTSECFLNSRYHFRDILYALK